MIDILMNAIISQVSHDKTVATVDDLVEDLIFNLEYIFVDYQI